MAFAGVLGLTMWDGDTGGVADPQRDGMPVDIS